MVQSEKYKLVFYNISRGVEFTIAVRGADDLARAKTFLDDLLQTSPAGAGSSPNNAQDHFVVDDAQLEAFQAFMNRSMPE